MPGTALLASDVFLMQCNSIQVKSAQVKFASEHKFERSQHVREVYVGAKSSPASSASANNSPDNTNEFANDARNSGAALRHLAQRQLAFDTVSLSNAGNIKTEFPQGYDANLLRIKHILEAYFGHKISLSFAVDLQSGGDSSNACETPAQFAPVDPNQVSAPEQQRWMHLSLRETEQTFVGISASITLSTGETIKVSMEETMARSLSLDAVMTQQEAQKFIDPLVINFEGPVQLSAQKSEFDLNGDGELDSIARFASNSAFLALDKNGDGIINDGSELFGVASGNGFADLAVYDEDGNGFIDANDSVFSKLLLFRPGMDRLQNLNTSTVFALYLGSVSSPFQLQDNNNDIAGRITCTGFYLKSDHGVTSAGTLQQIDLVI